MNRAVITLAMDEPPLPISAAIQLAEGEVQKYNDNAASVQTRTGRMVAHW